MITWLLILIYLTSFIANFDEKIFTKLAYLLETFMGALSSFKWAIWAFLEGYTLSLMLELILRVTTYIIKAL